ncbi:hypothetical protein WR25_19907 [Diploscapter pachys]|uniref:Uncharacterized protein n=1 Tax=Diploscapter pachys TaxID=2018661 RepID=A0A2A2JX70_9BILA|nr:hypothetical protein WR25_19907 [Diploscapter pachys]
MPLRLSMGEGHSRCCVAAKAGGKAGCSCEDAKTRRGRTACAIQGGEGIETGRAPGVGGRTSNASPSMPISRAKRKRPAGSGSRMSRLSAWAKPSGARRSHQISSPAR